MNTISMKKPTGTELRVNEDVDSTGNWFMNDYFNISFIYKYIYFIPVAFKMNKFFKSQNLEELKDPGKTGTGKIFLQ